MTRKSREGERGVVLLTVVFLVVILGGLSASLLFEGLGEQVSVEHQQTNMQALEVCELAAVRAQLEIFAMSDAAGDGIGSVSGTHLGGDYEAEAVQTPDYPDRWVVTIVGTHRNSRRRVQIGVRRRTNSDWTEGLFAREDLTLNGDLRTDAYDSRLGTYAAQATNSGPGGNYATGGGHVGSNSQIRTTGSAMHIRGNAIPGPSSSVVSAADPVIWGDIMPRRREIPIPNTPESEFATAVASNDNGNIIVSGGNGKPPYDTKTMALTVAGSRVVTLPGGTYFFSKVNFSGGATLVVTGPSTIYVTGQFDVSGGALLNQSGVPGNLLVYAHPYPLPAGSTGPSHSGVTFSGGPNTALALYAPEVDVVIQGNSDVYGAVVGRNINVMGDAYIHYDKALGDWNKFARVTLERLYWRDLDEKLR